MKKLLDKIKSGLSKAFGNVLGFLVKNGQVAIEATNIVKHIVQNPMVDWAVALTPTRADDKALALAKKLIPELSVKIGLAMNVIKIADAQESHEKAFAKVLEFISTQIPDEGKAIFYRELSAKIAESLTDGNISGGEAVAIVQLIFKKYI